MSFLYTQAHRGFSAKATCCAVPLVCGFLVYNRTRRHTYTNTHKDAKSEKERVVPPGPHLMETRSPGVLEHSSAPLSLRSTRGSIIMTHYTNSHPGVSIFHRFPPSTGGPSSPPTLVCCLAYPALSPYFLPSSISLTPRLSPTLTPSQPRDPFPPLSAACQSPTTSPPL